MKFQHFATAAVALGLMTGVAAAQTRAETQERLDKSTYAPTLPAAEALEVQVAPRIGQGTPQLRPEVAERFDREAAGRTLPSADALNVPRILTANGEANVATSTNVSARADMGPMFSKPVPDTPANRALYAPLSRAGRASAPAGN